MPDQPPLRVLITGAYGLLGNLLYARLAAQPGVYEVYGLAKDTHPSERAAERAVYAIPPERLRLADLTDLAAVSQAVTGMQAVVHLAGDPDGRASWASVLPNNIIGTHNLFEACRQVGVQRVIYGSTNQVVLGYTRDEAYQALREERWADTAPGAPPPIMHMQPARPLSDYACSKVYGEALAHMYAYTHGLSCLCLRIGWVLPDDRVPYPRAQTLWCSQRDIGQLFERCLTAPASLRFDIFFGQSANRHNLVDIQHARDVLGYAPEDRAEDQLA
jgi:nucleoside-diphosphate-sugar epimerase